MSTGTVFTITGTILEEGTDEAGEPCLTVEYHDTQGTGEKILNAIFACKSVVRITKPDGTVIHTYSVYPAAIQ